ncbi:hypothetical protein DICA1_F21814 [Diutina catenulata]
MLRVGRRYSTSGIIHNAVENVSKLLEQHDRSSYVLAQYIPEPARNTFLAIRAFNIEINKINSGGPGSIAAEASSRMAQSVGVSTVDLKFKFWSDMLQRVFTGVETPAEPIALLLRSGLEDGLVLNVDYFMRFLQTRRQFISGAPFATANDICAYGEGTYSQLNYQTQGVLLSPSISPSAIEMLQQSPSVQHLVREVAAHIGQATAVSSMILGMQYYASSQNQVTLPVDVMTKHDISQEQLLRLIQGHTKDSAEQEDVRTKLKNVVFDTAVTANDHILSARQKLAVIKKQVPDIVRQLSDNKLVQRQSRKWKGGIPDVVFTPFMVATPTVLYLDKLQSHDFDLFAKSMSRKEWKLGYTSFKNYYRRQI